MVESQVFRKLSIHFIKFSNLFILYMTICISMSASELTFWLGVAYEKGWRCVATVACLNHVGANIQSLPQQLLRYPAMTLLLISFNLPFDLHHFIFCCTRTCHICHTDSKGMCTTICFSAMPPYDALFLSDSLPMLQKTCSSEIGLKVLWSFS